MIIAAPATFFMTILHDPVPHDLVPGKLDDLFYNVVRFDQTGIARSLAEPDPAAFAMQLSLGQMFIKKLSIPRSAGIRRIQNWQTRPIRAAKRCVFYGTPETILERMDFLEMIYFGKRTEFPSPSSFAAGALSSPSGQVRMPLAGDLSQSSSRKSRGRSFHAMK
jgi:hypothetical protein